MESSHGSQQPGVEAEETTAAAVAKLEDAHDMIQIIDEDGTWTESLPEKMAKWNFHSKGFDYWVVSILGCQSSGKSTLLNLLFGTQFQVMNSQRGRSQTTKGIWMGRSANPILGKATDTLVLDVEGTDGRERGEEQKSFERKSSLFSLALAEVLIINLWFHDIGRWDAANYGLLKTVFELNLQLFGAHSGSSKTLLLFVIRDHVRAVTPLEPLTQAVEADLEKIWSGISKPDEFASSRVHDFFDIMYTSLSHKVLDPVTFAADAEALKMRFTDSEAHDFIFKDAYAKDVPADGWAIYAERIWQTIQESKDLDLPTQKEMLAMFRCDELMESAYRSFTAALEPIRQQLSKPDGPFVESFGQLIAKAQTEAIGMYEAPASRYHADVATRKGAALREKMLDTGYALFLQQIHKVYEAAVHHADKLAEALQPPTEGRGKEANINLSDLPVLLDDLKNKALQYFDEHAHASMVEGVAWRYDTENQDIRDHVENLVKRLRVQYVDHLLKRRQDKMRANVMSQLNKLLDSVPADMWARVANMHDCALERAQSKLRARLTRLGLTDDEISAREEELRERAFNVIKDRLVEKSQHILYQMKKKFDDAFRLDAEGLPRRWSKADNIDEIFKDARQQAYNVLDAYSIVRLRESDRRLSFFDESLDSSNVDPAVVVISADQCAMTRDAFKRESDSQFIEAKREQEREIAVRIPPFFWVVMLILGFNEIMALLGNPLLLFMFVVLSVMGYAAWLAGLLDVPLQVAQELYTDLTGRAKSAAVQTVMSRLTGPASSGSGSSGSAKDKRE